MINYSKHLILSFKTLLLIQETVSNLIFRISHFPTSNSFSSIVGNIFFFNQVRYLKYKFKWQFCWQKGNIRRKFLLNGKQIWGERKEMTANQSGWKNHVNDPLLKQPQFLICIQICNFSGFGIPYNFSVSNNLQFATKLRPMQW